MTVGPLFLIDTWLKNSQDGGSNIFTDDVKAVLLGAGQVLSHSFVGASGDGRYADLTAEFATGSGYTNGGLSIPNKTVVRTGNSVVLSGDPLVWTITAPILAAKYIGFYDFTSANKDLICAFDLDIDAPGTNTVTVAGPYLIVTPDPVTGFVRWHT